MSDREREVRAMAVLGQLLRVGHVAGGIETPYPGEPPEIRLNLTMWPQGVGEGRKYEVEAVAPDLTSAVLVLGEKILALRDEESIHYENLNCVAESVAADLRGSGG